jgi:uncharacterized protein YdhG (YjbR/CyaY superfamily)
MSDANKIQTIEEYIAACPADIQPKLIELTSIIRNAFPELKEKISWQMPSFYIKGYIMQYAAHKSHIGLYPGPEAIEVFADRLAGYKTSKGAIQIPNSKPLDTELITDMVKYNAENRK